ncbi:protein-serine,threonine phosphatase [Sarracenia purpurea var. burkii]
MAQQLAQAEVCTPWSLQVWRAVVNWLGFLFQILLQIAKVTPSMARLLSYLGLRHSLLSSSPPSFKPLPVVDDLSLAESSSASTVAPGYDAVIKFTDGAADLDIEKLTVRS